MLLRNAVSITIFVGIGIYIYVKILFNRLEQTLRNLTQHM